MYLLALVHGQRHLSHMTLIVYFHVLIFRRRVWRKKRKVKTVRIDVRCLIILFAEGLSMCEILSWFENKGIQLNTEWLSAVLSYLGRKATVLFFHKKADINMMFRSSLCSNNLYTLD